MKKKSKSLKKNKSLNKGTFFKDNLYTVMITLSMLAMSVAGAIMLPSSGENYMNLEALAAVSIHQIERCVGADAASEEGQDFEMIALGEDDADEETTEETTEDTTEDTTEETTEDNADDNTDDNADIEDSAAADDATTDDTSDAPAQEGDTAAQEGDTTSSADDDLESPTGVDDLESGDGESRFEVNEQEQQENKEKEEKVSEAVYTNPEWESVDESYLDDALFIGDSRTVGFGLYSQLENITVYAQKGFQIYNAATKPVVESEDGGKITLAEALKENKGKFRKVYIMFGLNEMGWKDDDSLDAYYYNLIDYIKETQPKSKIYLQSIIHVTYAKSTSNTTFTNERINARNEHLKKIAADEHIYYLDLNEVFTDENGALQADAASDGIHLKSEYILVWKDYILNHAVTSKAEKKAKEREAAKEKAKKEAKKKKEKLKKDKEELLELLTEDDE